MARRPSSGRAEESARLRAPGPGPAARLRLERETDPHMDSALLFTGRGGEPAAVWLFRDPDGSLSLSETAASRPARGLAVPGQAAARLAIMLLEERLAGQPDALAALRQALDDREIPYAVNRD
jgi:hypothetical protein